VAIKRATKRKWVRQVTTDSTHPPPGTFTGSAPEIARKMARRDVSPKGLGSGIRMIQYFINRGGKGLTATRRAELERAKRILQRRAARRKAISKKR
jgi:tRNA(adenine34) deaminase